MNEDIAPQLRQGVYDAYSAVAKNPQAQHHFPVGREFAQSLGYPVELLAQLPAAAVDAFAGLSNVSILAELSPGDTVLDLGCGAGLDSLIAAQRVGPTGRVIGLDFSPTMLKRAGQAAVESGFTQIVFVQVAAETLSLADATVDVALVNGIFNLNPGRERIFQELARVMRSGGIIYATEIILTEALPANSAPNKANWFA